MESNLTFDNAFEFVTKLLQVNKEEEMESNLTFDKAFDFVTKVLHINKEKVADTERCEYAVMTTAPYSFDRPRA